LTVGGESSKEMNNQPSKKRESKTLDRGTIVVASRSPSALHPLPIDRVLGSRLAFFLGAPVALFVYEQSSHILGFPSLAAKLGMFWNSQTSNSLQSATVLPTDSNPLFSGLKLNVQFFQSKDSKK